LLDAGKDVELERLVADESGHTDDVVEEGTPQLPITVFVDERDQVQQECSLRFESTKEYAQSRYVLEEQYVRHMTC
jgi:hypothetical protein